MDGHKPTLKLSAMTLDMTSLVSACDHSLHSRMRSCVMPILYSSGLVPRPSAFTHMHGKKSGEKAWSETSRVVA